MHLLTTKRVGLGYSPLKGHVAPLHSLLQDIYCTIPLSLQVLLYCTPILCAIRGKKGVEKCAYAYEKLITGDVFTRTDGFLISPLRISMPFSGVCIL